MTDIERQCSPIAQDELLKALRTWFTIEISQGDPCPNTLRCYVSSARCFPYWCRTSGTDCIAATAGDLKRYRAHLVQERYRRSTIATRLAGLRRLYDAFVDWGWREDNPGSGLKAKRDPTSRSEKIISKYIPDRQIFLDLYKLPDQHTVAGKRDRTTLRLLCYTGIRVSELCALNIEDLRLDDLPTLTIRAGKGRKRRHVPLGKDDVPILEAWISARKNIVSGGNAALIISLDHRTRGTRLSTRGAR